MATELTPKETREERPIINVHSILYWINKNDPLGQPPANPENDSQFELWETPIQKWLIGRTISGYTQDDVPKNQDSVHKPEFYPKISIVEPKNGPLYGYNSRVNIKIQNTGMFPLDRVDYFLNNAFIGSSKIPPFDFSFTPKDIDSLNDVNELRVVGYDTVYNSGQSSVIVNINRN